MTDQAYPDALSSQYRMHWYTIERVLGQGGFGITYLARDTNLDQTVAIKEYLPVDVAARRPDGTVQSRGDGQRERYRWGLERFIQEARTLARFDHPNIVRVHSVFEYNGTAYMVMRFEEGENLATMLERRGTLPEQELLRILLPILDGLELVHNAGFIHRDIKPDNIHIRTDGSPVLLDFGSARHALGKARTLTILVAPGYAPFEQYYSSSENQGPWTDIYGLGATCYRVIAGTPPLDAISRSKGILGSTREVLVPASTVGSGRYSGRLLAAVDHALVFAEKERPQNIAEWRRELKGEGVAVAASSPAERGARPPAQPPAIGVSAAPAGPVSRAPDAPASGMRMQLVWAIFGAIAGAIAIAIFLRVTAPDRDAELALIEKQREAQAGEKKRLAEEADKQKQAQEVEKKRQAEEAERQRLAQEAESKRLVVQETETKRQAEEAERQRLAQEAKRKRFAQEAERKRLVEQAEGKRQTDRERLVLQKKAIEPVPPRPDPAPEAPVAPPKAPETGRKPNAQELLARAAEAESRGDFSATRQILTELGADGNAAAQTRLAELYASGRGVPVNNFQAYVWYSLAVRCGNAAAAAGRAKMADGLQPAQRAQADSVVAGMKVCL